MSSSSDNTGELIYRFLEQLWPYCRSITGDGVRQTLSDIQQHLQALKVLEIPSGTKALDWTVPDEWNIREAWVKDKKGQTIIDFSVNNLHVVGYSEPFSGKISKKDLLNHLFSLPDQPDLIPYVTSYYKRRWGFCVPYNMLRDFRDDEYEVYIDSDLEPGSLSIGEYVLKGETDKEIVFSTYCCHPSLANDQLSGVGLATYLAKWLSDKHRLKHTYRFLFLPEIIGSAAYLQKNADHLKKQVIAAFNLTCVGDNRMWSYLPSRSGNTLADKAILNLLKYNTAGYKAYTWNDRGSDESMFCAPGIDLPMVSLMRSKYGEFPEYHTSADTLGGTVTVEGLETTFNMFLKLINALENYAYPRALVFGEPQLGKRGLYPDLSIKGSTATVKHMLNVLSYSDGYHDIFDISNRSCIPVEQVLTQLNKLSEHRLVTLEPVNS